MAPKRQSRASLMSTQPNQHSNPARSRVQLTQIQKQALIDNLQLEITERARKLRAQYALQAQSLRTRLEIRVHRIPVPLRKRTIAELLEQHQERTEPKSPVRALSPKALRQHRATPSPQSNSKSPALKGYSIKRKSDAMDDDRENRLSESHPAAKKRALPNHDHSTSQPAAAPRNTSRRALASQVLSPKSNNARAFPHSPYKPTMSPSKPLATRPISPSKATIQPQRDLTQPKTAEKQVKVKSTTATRAPRKRAANSRAQGAKDDTFYDEQRRRSNVSEATNSSSSTTIVRASRKPALPKPSTVPVTKGKVAGITGKLEGISASSKTVQPKPAARGAKIATAGTGRTLRKRA